MWTRSTCYDRWEDFVNMWFSIYKLGNLKPRLKGAGSTLGSCCWLGVSNVLIYSLIHWLHCQSLSNTLQQLRSRQHAINGQNQGTGISFPLAGTFSLLILPLNLRCCLLLTKLGTGNESATDHSVHITLSPLHCQYLSLIELTTMLSASLFFRLLLVLIAKSIIRYRPKCLIMS